MGRDFEREIHGGAGDDAPSYGECLADVSADIAAIESGDLSAVAPWCTPDEALVQLRAERDRYVARLAA